MKTKLKTYRLGLSVWGNQNGYKSVVSSGNKVFSSSEAEFERAKHKGLIALRDYINKILDCASSEDINCFEGEGFQVHEVETDIPKKKPPAR